MVTRNTLSISDLKLIVRNHTDNDHQNTIDINDMRITFEQFCGIVTEFTQSSTTLLNGNSNGIDLDLHSSRGANTFSTNIYINWKIAFITTQQLLRIYVVKPLTNIIGIEILITIFEYHTYFTFDLLLFFISFVNKFLFLVNTF